jgi:hypothetical protein
MYFLNNRNNQDNYNGNRVDRMDEGVITASKFVNLNDLGGMSSQASWGGWGAASTTLDAFGFASGIKETIIEGGAALSRGINISKVNDVSLIRTYGVSGAKYFKYTKSLGVIGSIATTGYSVGQTINQYNSGGLSEVFSHRDILDAGVGGVGLGASALAAAGLISNPIGWGIGIGVLLYGGVTLIYDAVTENP